MPLKKRRRRTSRKKGKLRSVKKLLKNEEFQNFVVKVIREIIDALKH